MVHDSRERLVALIPTVIVAETSSQHSKGNRRACLVAVDMALL